MRTVFDVMTLTDPSLLDFRNSPSPAPLSQPQRDSNPCSHLERVIRGANTGEHGGTAYRLTSTGGIRFLFIPLSSEGHRCNERCNALRAAFSVCGTVAHNVDASSVRP